MNRTVLGALWFFSTAFLALAPSISASCSAFPPCGPIPVIIEVKIQPWKGLTFEDGTQLVLTGTVSYYVDVDQDGFYFDPANQPVLTFRVNREPPWIRTSFEPSEYHVPVADPTLFGPQEGGASELQYYWEAPITITIEKVRDPTPEELSPESSWIRRDGTYRVTASGSSTGSVLAPDAAGNSLGLQEGYGVREFRFIPEIDGVEWVLNEERVLVPSDGASSKPEVQVGGQAPASGFLTVLVLVLATMGALRLRRR